MNTLQGFALFTTGVRVTILCLLITVLVNAIRLAKNSGEDAFTRIARSPKILLGLILTLLGTSICELVLEILGRQ